MIKMDWRSHAMIGAASALCICHIFLGVDDIIGLIAVGAFGAIGALVPDLDHDSSKGRRILDIVFISLAFFLIFLSGCGEAVCIPSLEAVSSMTLLFFAFLGAYFLFFRFFKPAHRGITHTLVAGILFGALVFLFSGSLLAIAGTCGYVSHLVADRHLRMI